VQDAYDMLNLALNDPDPVLNFENTLLYNTKGALDTKEKPLPIGKALVHKKGKDITILTYGINLLKSLEAAEILKKEGIDAEVIDLRTLRPLDDKSIMKSVKKTHHVLIVDDGWKSGSISAEIMARINEQAFYELDAPMARVCCAEIPLPYAKHLEDFAIPQVEKIVKKARELKEKL
jgi:pyruvate/2-oxoglutarate/acetoin dehydrogenase E1 component